VPELWFIVFFTLIALSAFAMISGKLQSVVEKNSTLKKKKEADKNRLEQLIILLEKKAVIKIPQIVIGRISHFFKNY